MPTAPRPLVIVVRPARDRELLPARKRPIESVDEDALVVALEEVDVEPALAGGRAARRLDVRQRPAPVELRLAGAEEVEVRPVEDEDGRHGTLRVVDVDCDGNTPGRRHEP